MTTDMKEMQVTSSVPESRETLPTVGEDEKDSDSTVSGLSQPSGLEMVPEEENDKEISSPPKEIQSTAMNEKKSEIIAVNTSLSLQEMVEERQWLQAIKLLSRKNERGVAEPVDVVSIPFRGYGGDYPLHVLCDWDYAEEEDEKNEARQAGKKGREGKKTRNAKTNNTSSEILKKEAPPFDLIKLVYDAYPKAVRTRGRDGSLPLHYAARGCAPRDILEFLIKAFPQALDVTDDYNESPRDFLQQSTENTAILDRPTCCWVQHFHDEKERDHVEDEITELSNAVTRLEQEIANEVTLESELLEQLEEFEERISEFSKFPHGKNIEQRAKELEDFFGSEIEDMESTLVEMGTTLEHKYDKPHSEREYIRSFDEDIALIYKDIESTKSKLKLEIEALQRSVCAAE